MLLNSIMILFSIWCLSGLIGAGFLIAEDININRENKHNWLIEFKIFVLFIYILSGFATFHYSIKNKLYKYGWRILDLNKYN